jgi:alcohol-forming fatty acyl-CoA reductase
MRGDAGQEELRESTAESGAKRLDGKKVLLTGASGFLGKAVLGAIATQPRQLVVALRAREEAAARQRLQDALGDGALPAERRDEILARLEAGSLRAVAANLERDGFGGADGSAWDDVDIVIHCAASVSFEEPLDEALAINTLGPSRLLAKVQERSPDPHFVHVSTAYVATQPSGIVREDAPPNAALAALDPAAMLAEGQEWREQVERESQSGSLWRGFKRGAERDASRRRDLDAGQRAEELRARWVQAQLSHRGRQRAVEAGWPDTYALSKALGERLLTESGARLTIVRPTIIESALRRPHPGWLEGIKVADPLILAYAARGLTHLPGRASNTIDIVPVDFVANACLTAAAHPHGGGTRRIAIASSARNPLTLGELAEQIRRYFRQQPLLEKKGNPIKIGELRFVPRRVAVGRAERRRRLAAAAARAAMASPVPLPQERMLRGSRALAERVSRMVSIYGSYTELDSVFDDANARRLEAQLGPDERDVLGFDTASIDWGDYLQRVHLPQLRRLSTGR